MSAAQLTGIAILENPRHVESKGKSCIFDAQLYLGERPLVVLLRYFNHNDFSFENEARYFIHANVSI